MKLRAQREGLAIRVTVDTANVAKDQLVKLTGDNAVDSAGENEFPIGRLVKPSRTAAGVGTVECNGRIKEKIEIKNASGGALVAGDFVKMAAVDGTTGESCVGKWVTGTDAFERNIGIVCKGGANAAVVEVLTF